MPTERAVRTTADGPLPPQDALKLLKEGAITVIYKGYDLFLSDIHTSKLFDTYFG